MSNFYENSPELVDDIDATPGVSPPADKPAPANPAPPVSGSSAFTPDAAPWLRSNDELLKEFYDPRLTHSQALRNVEQGMLEALATPDEAKAAVEDWWPVFGRYELSTAESEALVSAGLSVHNEPATQQQLSDWAADTREQLRAEYGDRAGVVLDAARRMIARDQPLKAYLDRTGLGNHPRVALAMARSADRFVKAGKLK